MLAPTNWTYLNQNGEAMQSLQTAEEPIDLNGLQSLRTQLQQYDSSQTWSNLKEVTQVLLERLGIVLETIGYAAKGVVRVAKVSDLSEFLEPVERHLLQA